MTGDRTITVLGLPCAGGGALDEAAADALARADLVVGGARHLDAVAPHVRDGTRTITLGQLAPALDAIDRATDAVVVASGDPGFFGIVRVLRERLDAREDAHDATREGAHHATRERDAEDTGNDGATLRVLPAVSAVAALAAAAGTNWDDAVVVSAHGRDRTTAVNICRRWPKVFVLTEPGFGPADLAALVDDGRPRRWVVGERLGTPEARITDGPQPPPDAADPNVVLVLDDAATEAGTSFPARRTALRWGLHEDAFEHRAGMVTKAEVRAIALAHLGPGLGDLLWDVGAGSGSVAVEAARLGAAAVAVEFDPAQCDRVRRNAARCGVRVDVVEGKAPGVLADLPDPDIVFVGGAGVDLDVVVAVAAIRARRAVVVALATVERVAPAHAALEAAGFDVEAVLVQTSRLTPLAGGHRLAGGNPVFLVAGHRP